MKPITLSALLFLSACAGTQTTDTASKAPDCRGVTAQLKGKHECPHHKGEKCDCADHDEGESCEGH